MSESGKKTEEELEREKQAQLEADKKKGPETTPPQPPPQKVESEVTLGQPDNSADPTAKGKELAKKEEESKKVSVSIEADPATLKRMKDAYIAAMKKNDKDWKEEDNLNEKDGKLNVTFPSEKHMTDFLQEMAKTEKFMLIDAKTNKVIAFSNGDGNLYKFDKDGKAEKYDREKHGSLLPKSEKDLDNCPKRDGFKIPDKVEPKKDETQSMSMGKGSSSDK